MKINKRKILVQLGALAMSTLAVMLFIEVIKTTKEILSEVPLRDYKLVTKDGFTYFGSGQIGDRMGFHVQLDSVGPVSVTLGKLVSDKENSERPEKFRDAMMVDISDSLIWIAKPWGGRWVFPPPGVTVEWGGIVRMAWEDSTNNGSKTLLALLEGVYLLHKDSYPKKLRALGMRYDSCFQIYGKIPNSYYLRLNLGQNKFGAMFNTDGDWKNITVIYPDSGGIKRWFVSRLSPRDTTCTIELQKIDPQEFENKWNQDEYTHWITREVPVFKRLQGSAYVVEAFDRAIRKSLNSGRIDFMDFRSAFP